jgi:hypothetical protein
MSVKMEMCHTPDKGDTIMNAHCLRVRPRTGLNVVLLMGISTIGGLCFVFAYPSLAQALFHIAPVSIISGKRVLALRFIISFPFFALLGSWMFLGFRYTNDFLHRYRYLMGAAVICCAVLLNVNGSSLGMWNGWLGHNMFQDVVFGTPRAIRTDEYVVNTPLAFSQQYAGYSYFNSIVGGQPSDMFIIKDAPVWTFAEVFRPFHWGYLLLGSSRGLAFYWSTRLVTLFLATYELMLLLTRNSLREQRGIALICATSLTFSPFVQWWFAVNNLPEMIIAVSFSVVCADRYCKEHRVLLRSIYAAAIAECFGMFALALYPAWQIPLAYVALILFAYVVMGNWGHIRIQMKEILILFLLFVILCMLLGTVFYFSRGTIYAATHTVYPGVRDYHGGGVSMSTLLTGTATILIPFKTISAGLNPTETAGFVDLFPLGMVLAVVNAIRTKKLDPVSLLLFVISSLFVIYAVVGFPLWLARITLLSQVSGSRMRVAIGIVNIFLLARESTLSRLSGNHWPEFSLVLVYCLLVLGVVRHSYPSTIGRVLTTVLLALSILMCIAIIFSKIYAAGVCELIAVFSLVFSGISVNPVQYGTRPMTDQGMINEVKGINRIHPGIWAVDGDDSARIANLLIANGVTTMNAVSVTPKVKEWKKIDPRGQYEYVYNRYALITVNSVPVTPSRRLLFKVTSPDAFELSPTIDDLHKLGVRYVLSSQNLTRLDAHNLVFAPIGEKCDGRQPYMLVPRT